MTVVGIVMKVFQIVVAIVVGIAAGCQPLVGYNYGAGHIDRVRQILKTMMAAEIAVGLVSLLCFQMFPGRSLRCLVLATPCMKNLR